MSTGKKMEGGKKVPLVPFRNIDHLLGKRSAEEEQEGRKGDNNIEVTASAALPKTGASN